MFDEIEKFLKVPEEWAPPESKPYTPGVSLLHSNSLSGEWSSWTHGSQSKRILSFFMMSYQFLQENLQKWLMDEKARDQFVIRAGSDTEVLWNDARQSKPELVYKRSVS